MLYLKQTSSCKQQCLVKKHTKFILGGVADICYICWAALKINNASNEQLCKGFLPLVLNFVVNNQFLFVLKAWDKISFCLVD